MRSIPMQYICIRLDITAVKSTANIPRWIVSSLGGDLPDGHIFTFNSPVTSPVIAIAFEMNVNKSGNLDVAVGLT